MEENESNKIKSFCAHALCSQSMIEILKEREWRIVKDKKPPNDVYVLVARYDGRKNVNMIFLQIAKRLHLDWFDDHNEEKLDPKYGTITHWMPLPDLPKPEFEND